MSKPRKKSDPKKAVPKADPGKPSSKPAKASKSSAVPSKFLERFSQDEGITGGIADDEAMVLLDALKKELAKQAAGMPDAAVEAAYAKVAARGRRLAKVVAAWIHDGEHDEARRIWAEGGGPGTLDAVPTDDAVAAMKELLSREGLGRA